MGIVRFALKWPHTFYVLAALIVFLGITAIIAMPSDIFPEIDIPVVTIIWQYTGLTHSPMARPSAPTTASSDVGSLVQADATAGTFMFTVMNSDVLRIQLYVPQDDVFGLKPGVAAIVHVPEMPDRIFGGTVTRIADALQTTTRTLLTEIDVPNADGALNPGVYCTVELQIPRVTPSLIVPADALVFDAGGLRVAVVENGVAHFRQITEIRDLGTGIEVSAGVKSGDQVILNPPVDLADGAPVQAHLQVAVPGDRNLSG
jgi:multidrug efflux pump subunit AcrA (membrane-fusion protein)